MTTNDKNGTTLKNRIKPSTQIEDFTDDELVDLTPTEIDYYVDLEAARSGVPLLPPHPGEAPQKPEPVLDEELYEVKMGYTTLLICNDHDDALDLASTVKGILAGKGARHIGDIGGYGTGVGKYITGDDERTVEIAALGVASPGSRLDCEKEVEAYKRLKARHAEALKEWQEARDGREEIESGVREAIEEARIRVRRRERAQTRLDRYIELAAGNRAMALRFLEAHDSSDIRVLGLEDEVRELTVEGVEELSAEDDMI